MRTPERIISLLPSSTEILCSLGLRDRLVGVSHECDFPPSVRRLPVCTAPKFAVEGTSLEIDQRVKAVLQEGLSVYRVHADLLKRLRPDVIVTQSHCEVCAVSQRDVEEAVKIQNRSRYGNAASVFTESGAVARYVMEKANAGMVGVNVGVPVPREPFSFGGWNESKFGVGDITGRGSLEFWTKSKKMTTKWNKEAGVNWMS